MVRTSIATVFIAVMLSACASKPAQPPMPRDNLDELMTSSAAAVTRALRDLSEASGESRVVVATNKEAAAAQSPRVAEPRPSATSIASRKGILAVDADDEGGDAKVGAGTALPQVSTGVVATGGLLSAPPQGLEKLITVRWTGDLEQLLARIAQATGWNIGETRGLRVTPVIVSISAESRSAFDVLRDIGAIAGSSADIHVAASTKTLSVHYPKR